MTKRSGYTIYIDRELIAAVDLLIEGDRTTNRSKFIEDATRKAVESYPVDELEEQLRRQIDRCMLRLDLIKQIGRAPDDAPAGDAPE